MRSLITFSEILNGQRAPIKGPSTFLFSFFVDDQKVTVMGVTLTFIYGPNSTFHDKDALGLSTSLPDCIQYFYIKCEKIKIYLFGVNGTLFTSSFFKLCSPNDVILGPVYFSNISPQTIHK